MTYIQWVHAKVHGGGPGEIVFRHMSQFVQGTEQVLPTAMIRYMCPSASSTGLMLVATDDLHPIGTCQTLFQLVQFQLVQGTEQVLPTAMASTG